MTEHTMKDMDNMEKPQGSGDASGQEGADLSQQLAEKDEALKACQDKMLRLAAELDNYKKRVDREKAEHMKYALEAFAKELLPFLDNLERALASAYETKDIEALIQGIELTLGGYIKTVEQFGLTVFASEGSRFDPHIHEALAVEEHPHMDENTVVRELLKGYKLHEKVLRPALVVVSKKPSEGSGQG